MRLACERGVAYFGRLADTGLMRQKTIKPDITSLSRLGNQSIKTQLWKDSGNKMKVALGPDTHDGNDGHILTMWFNEIFQFIL